MYILDNDKRYLQATYYNGTGDTSLVFICSYADISDRTFTQGTQLTTVLKNDNLYTILSPPSAVNSVKRQLKACSVFNSTQHDAKFYIYYTDNADGEVQTLIQDVTLLTKQSLYYTDGVGWYKNASNNITNLIQHNALQGINGGTYHLNVDPYNYLRYQNQSLLTNSVVTHSQLALLTIDTAPFSVSSVILVQNLNADLLDGYHAIDFSSSFLPRSGGQVIGNIFGVGFSGSGDGQFKLGVTSSAFKGDGSQITNVNADLLDGLHAMQFYFTNSTVTNSMTSSTLQGTNSAGFAVYNHYHYGYGYQYSLLTSSIVQDCTLSLAMITSSLNLSSNTNIIFPLNVNVYQMSSDYFIPKTSYKIFTNSGVSTTFNRLQYSYSVVPGTASIALSFTTSTT